MTKLRKRGKIQFAAIAVIELTMKSQINLSDSQTHLLKTINSHANRGKVLNWDSLVLSYISVYGDGYTPTERIINISQGLKAKSTISESYRVGDIYWTMQLRPKIYNWFVRTAGSLVYNGKLTVIPKLN